MCIIAICKDKKLTHAEWERCWDKNSHGMGIASWDGKKITVSKGHMKKGEAWEAYREATLPHVVHFRLASAGSQCAELTHPFIVSPGSETDRLEYKTKNSVLFHNGTLHDWKTLLVSAIMQTKTVPLGEMSDSRAMAIACSVAGTDLPELYNNMRWVIVSKNGFKKFGSWEQSKAGQYFSNDGYLESIKIEYKWTSDNRKYFWESQKSGVCQDCLYFEDVPGQMGECGLKGSLVNRIACKDFLDGDSVIAPASYTEKQALSKRNNKKNWKSCKSCDCYAGEAYGCNKHGKLANYIACKDWADEAIQASVDAGFMRDPDDVDFQEMGDWHSKGM